MRNNYKTSAEALSAWHSDAWKWEREYFKNIKTAACVCGDGEKFFIVCHPDCVAFRIKIGQMIFTL